MLSLIGSVVVGGGLGAALGRFGQCSTGSCLLMANWKRGAVYGAFMGALFYLAAGDGSGAYPETKNIKTITEADFNIVAMEAGKPVVVDFYAPWCGPCKILAPRLDALAGEYSDKINFMSVNVDKSPELAAKFNVEGVPTLLFIGKDGQIMDAMAGLVSADTLRAKLQSLVGS